jgi:hypothetical protein
MSNIKNRNILMEIAKSFLVINPQKYSKPLKEITTLTLFCKMLECK